jgi:hypothetical protein
MDIDKKKNRTNANAGITAIQATLTHLKWKVEGHGCKLYTDYVFSLPD